MPPSTGRTPSADPARHLFLGREPELRQLVAALQDTSDTGHFVVVLGEAGIGKTSLIDAALAAAGRPVLRATADSMGRRRTHGLLLDAVAPVLTDEDRSIITGQAGYAAGERLHTVIDRVTAEPAVLVLEDLHWADADSLGMLARLSHTLEQIPLLIIGSLRTQASHATAPGLDHLLSVLSERGLVDMLRLGPLPHSTCVAITEQLTGGSVEGVLAHRVAAAGGNPLFLTELIRALLRDGAVTIGPHGEALLDAPAGPSPSLAMVIMRHLSHLTAPTRELLATAALLGTRFPAAQLRVAAQRPMSDLVPMLREALAAGILEEEDTHELLGFRHELIRAVLLQDLPATVRAELHRELAIRLDAAGVSPATVAEHLLRAPVAAQDLEWMQQLAERTTTIAPATASQLWRSVLESTAADSVLHARASAGLASAALREGRIAEAGQIADRTLQYAPPPDVFAPLAVIRTHSLMMARQHGAAREAAEEYAASQVLEPADRAEHLAFAAWPRFMLGDIAGAERVAREAVRAARAVGSCGAEVYALTLQGLIANCRGALGDAVALLTAAVAKVDRHPCLTGIESFPHAQLAVALADLDRTVEVVALLDRGQRISTEFDYRTGVLAVHTLGAHALSHSENLSDVAAELDAHQSVVSAMDLQLDRPIRGLWAHVLAHQSGPAAAVKWACRLDPVPDRGTWAGRGRSWVWQGRSQLERARGDVTGTFDVLWTGWEELRDDELMLDCVELGLDLACLATRVHAEHPSSGEVASERAHEVVELLAALAGRNLDVAHLRATALAVRGITECDAEALVEAERLFAATVRRLDHARVAELAALALPARDAVTRRLAETSLRGYSEVGALHDVARARAAFRKAGVRVLSAVRTRPAVGWDSLTRTEERIARHVATGATNPEIAQRLCVSRRTVESHVSNVLAKLGLRSRTEVAVLVARRLEDAGQHG